MISAIAAMSLRNLVHCVLCLAVTFAGIALVFLQLGAEFIGFAQILVYIGAVSILILFALLMTRGGNELTLRQWNPGHWLTGTLVGLGVFSLMAVGIYKSTVRQASLPSATSDTLHSLGDSLLNQFVLPLEVMALLLTVALIGAALLASPDKNQANQSNTRTNTSGDS